MPTVESSSIPPIEIGSFDAFNPQKSEFIGSSSGVFFVNTVFHTFARHRRAAPQGGIEAPEPAGTPSVHEYVGTAEPEQPTATPRPPINDLSGQAHSNAYGIDLPGLGEPPCEKVAKNLMKHYFQYWHPFYPFLHGPTFFDSLESIYHSESSNPEDHSQAYHDKLCRAVTYQCIFNIAASAHPHKLPEASQIRSPSVLTDIVGTLSARHDVASFQALIAVELYLISIMSLRPASTVHGLLVRLVYHSGLHRCPFRYIQLTREMCEMRKRILWSVYTMDRYLSQSLGYPLGLQDSDIDVCIPGAEELHKPVTLRLGSGNPAHSSVEDTRSHLPRSRSTPRSTEDNQLVPQTLQQMPSTISTGSIGHGGNDPPASQTPAFRVQGHFVTYSQLVAEALELFHKSLHTRSATLEKITDLTCRIQSWWNGLPVEFQDDDILDGKENGSHGPFVAFFTISYHHLLILINRPFLSLKQDTMDFRSSLQRAIGASRGVVSKLRLISQDPFLTSCPAILSATWMAGLVLAFATMLDMYPLSKADIEINKCLVALRSMSPRWTNARSCQHALKALLSRLHTPSITSQTTTTEQAENGDDRQSLNTDAAAAGETEEPRATKRKRIEDASKSATSTRVPAENLNQPLSEDIPAWPTWTPVLQYNGPDFGFDALHLGFQQGDGEGLGEFDFSNAPLLTDMTVSIVSSLDKIENAH
ncbi:hypothetical protein PFICI_10206 [Pestalotiopsis fici W106-1]|uniref:Xylanolytic transcriptional activator regulatory domain-containing protein n=1 Tax=Pestalotiopsis fici (strain W106-1 / CGMCC3.15140) TaxID=1229662 RepID=W3WWG3_PESFW|nr:uncharacterized protein PFICI_10206 [Pestalotiopsis fici W106-1]ETS78144.1 hypothetical protein PFICI_10206 [Pestalotiopsis fici W106-1]